MGVQSRLHSQPGPVPPKMPLEASGTGPWAVLGSQRQGAGLAICVTREMLSLLPCRGSPSVGGSTGSPDSLHRGSGDRGPPSGDVEGLATGIFASFRDVGETPQAPLSREKGRRVTYSGQPQDHHGDHQTELRSSSKSVPVKPMGVGFPHPLSMVVL